ncbi:extensin family protein [Halomonas sp. THAF12]|nr:extensin family protein [Halomonas sp. THAF12]
MVVVAALEAVRRQLAQPAGTVLGPDYNAAHADHFHLALRGWRVCH